MCGLLCGRVCGQPSSRLCCFAVPHCRRALHHLWLSAGGQCCLCRCIQVRHPSCPPTPAHYSAGSAGGASKTWQARITGVQTFTTALVTVLDLSIYVTKNYDAVRFLAQQGASARGDCLSICAGVSHAPMQQMLHVCICRCNTHVSRQCTCASRRACPCSCCSCLIVPC